MKYDVIIIGGGPGGYVAAIRMQQYGLNVAVIEKERLGGVCLNWGCIPTKSLVKVAEVFKEIKESASYGIALNDPQLDYQAVWQRKNKVVEQLVSGVEFIFKKREIPNLKETVRKVEPDEEGYRVFTDKQEYTAKYVVLATGSKPKALPFMEFDGNQIMSSTDILKMQQLPEHLVVVGGGVIGCEFASIFNHFGVKVEIVEFLPELVSTEDKEISKRLALALKKTKIKLHLKTAVEGFEKEGDKLLLKLSSGKEIKTEKVLLSVGREAQLDLEFPEEQLATENGFIIIDENCLTNLPNVFAIGDVTGKMMLAHVASKQALQVADQIAIAEKGVKVKPEKVVLNSVPACTFTDPEVASVGLTEQELEESAREYKVGKFPFSANGKSLGLGNRFGFVKVIADAADGKLLGMHMIGPQATELIAQGAVMIGSNMNIDDIKKIVFAHPTLSECVMEAVEDLESLAIHIV